MAYEPIQTLNLSIAIRRQPTTFVVLLADVEVPVDVPARKRYRAEDERNQESIDEAIEAGESSAEVTIRAQGRKATWRRLVEDAMRDKQDWLELWSMLLSTEIVDVHTYQVLPVFRRRRQ